jgi:hypothetical protein
VKVFSGRLTYRQALELPGWKALEFDWRIASAEALPAETSASVGA